MSALMSVIDGLVFKNMPQQALDVPDVLRNRQKSGSFPFPVLNLIFLQPQQAGVRE